MATRRRILLDSLDAWRAEGVLDDATWRLLRARYENAPSSDELDGGVAAAAAAPEAPGEKRSFAADAMQFVGGLLVGAALVALVVFLDVGEPANAWLLLGLGAVMAAPAAYGAWVGWNRSLVQAGLSGSLVPALVAAGIGGGNDVYAIPMLVAAACVGVLLLLRGEGPTTLVAAGGYAFAGAASTLFRESFFFGNDQMGVRWAWLGLLLALLPLLLLWRQRLWASVSLGLYVAPLAFAFALILDGVDTLTSVGAELVMGAYLGALLGIGIWTGSRGLVAGAAAGLTIDAVVLAFDVGGPGTAVVLLLVLGALLVWQGQVVRGYFRGKGERI